MKIVKWTLTITVITWTKIFLLDPASQYGPISQFLNGMPDWMKMTPDDINLAVESLPYPSEGHILPGISLQDTIDIARSSH
jgi:hypothetical protein